VPFSLPEIRFWRSAKGWFFHNFYVMATMVSGRSCSFITSWHCVLPQMNPEVAHVHLRETENYLSRSGMVSVFSHALLHPVFLLSTSAGEAESVVDDDQNPG